MLMGKGTEMRAVSELQDLETRHADEIVSLALEREAEARVCLTCSFQAEDIIVLHLLRRRLPNIPVLFLETGYHFAETYEFRDKLASEWGLTLVNVLPKKTVKEQESERGILYREDPTKCCQLRKVEPLKKKLSGLKAWVTGVRRDQAPTRAGTRKLEWDAKFGLVKLNPIADWNWKQVWEYIRANNVPYNPLHDQNYPSIGCTHCTRPVQPDEDPRAGRWSGFNKIECGLHVKDPA